LQLGKKTLRVTFSLDTQETQARDRPLKSAEAKANRYVSRSSSCSVGVKSNLCVHAGLVNADNHLL